MHSLTAAASRAAATASAVLLTTASAGFGTYYAWTNGAHRGPVLGSLAVAMALGLELCKPFAVSGAFSSLRRWRVGQSVALAALGLVAVAYSLSAELSLMAATRGDAVAERAASVETARRSRETRERLTAELADIPPARAAAELQALIDGVLMDPRSGGCATIDGKFTREHCPDVASWRSELGRAQHRAEIEQQLGRLGEQSAGAVRTADPGAEALAAYLSAFGVSIPSSMLSEWLVLVGVIALELGSALAAVLVGAMDGGGRSSGSHPVRSDTVNGVEAKPDPKPAASASTRGNRRLGDAGRTAAEMRIVAELERAGGRIRSGSSVRAIARRIGASRGTTFNALASLIAAGVVERIAGNLVLR